MHIDTVCGEDMRELGYELVFDVNGGAIICGEGAGGELGGGADVD